MAKTCSCCGKALGEKENGIVSLKDGQLVCKDCADQTRILYPYRYTKVQTESIFSEYVRDEIIHKETILGKRIDPLCDMTAEEFRVALEEARKAAKAQAAKYAGAKAVIEADHVRKYFINVGSEDKPRYNKRKVYGVFGKVLYGDLISGAEVTVSHKDRDYSAKSVELQDWDGTSAAGAPVGKASAGMLVNIVFAQEMNFVYPGDTLIVR